METGDVQVGSTSRIYGGYRMGIACGPWCPLPPSELLDLTSVRLAGLDEICLGQKGGQGQTLASVDILQMRPTPVDTQTVVHSQSQKTSVS